jgi:transcriptional regulator with XRE-family HTH domain
MPIETSEAFSPAIQSFTFFERSCLSMATVTDGAFPVSGTIPMVRTANTECQPVSLHRIAEVRQQQGVSLRAVSRRIGIDVRTLREQECPSSNLTLTELYRWQEALDVPIQNLLCDHDDSLSERTQMRAALVKLMKTVKALTEVASSPRVARMTTMLHEQMLEIMPELAEIGSWPTYGSRRPTDEVGRIAESPIDVNSLSIE